MSLRLIYQVKNEYVPEDKLFYLNQEFWILLKSDYGLYDIKKNT